MRPQPTFDDSTWLCSRLYTRSTWPGRLPARRAACHGCQLWQSLRHSGQRATPVWWMEECTRHRPAHDSHCREWVTMVQMKHNTGAASYHLNTNPCCDDVIGAVVTWQGERDVTASSATSVMARCRLTTKQPSDSIRSPATHTHTRTQLDQDTVCHNGDTIFAINLCVRPLSEYTFDQRFTCATRQLEIATLPPDATKPGPLNSQATHVSSLARLSHHTPHWGIHCYRTGGVSRRRASRSVTRDNA